MITKKNKIVIKLTFAIYESIWDRQRGGIPYMKAYPSTHTYKEKEGKNRKKKKISE